MAAGTDTGGTWEGLGMSAAAARDEIVLAFDVLKTPDATLSVAMNRRIVACNDAAEGLLGYRAEELIGALFCDLIGRCHANGQDACRRRCAAIGNAERGRPTPDFEMSIVARAGVVKWVHVTTLLARSASGHKRVVHLMRDVTALHQLDETRARSIVHTGQATIVPASEHVDPATPFPHPHQLTPRELDVLRLLACGLTTDVIAATFGISPVTARNHITKIMEKLGAATRLQAVVIASQAGLI
jgi:PAS domain S-box-containing protein